MTRIAFVLMVALACAAPAVAHVEVPGLDLNGQCVGDKDGDSQVNVSELVTAVNNALNGCERLPITLSFHAMVGDKDFVCGTTYDGIGTGASQYIPSDFRFYVSNVKLVTIGGAEVPLDMDSDPVWQVSQDGQGVAMIDFETGPDNGCSSEGNSATNTEVHGTVPAGVYSGVKFDLGLPFALNHRDVSTAPSPLNFSAMFWSWNGGYRFLRIDTADDKFRVHLGSTGCNGASPSRPPTSCDHPNLPTISLSGFNPSHSIIVADLAALLADNNIDMNVPDTPPGCSSDQNDTDCVPVFSHLGMNFADGSASPATQSFFRIAEDHSSEHVEIKVASAADGSGALVAHPEFDTDVAIPLPASACLGGTGDECTGGTRIFTAVNPGIEPLAESEPDESIYKLPDAVQVTLEATALDPALMIRLGDQVIDAVGKTIVLGTTPDFHADLETDLSLPGGSEPSGTYSASFKLTTTSSQFQSSEAITLKFTPTEAAHQE